MTTNDDIMRAIGRLEGTVDTFIKQMGIADDRAAKSAKELETRVRSVERKQYWLSGVGSVAGVIAGALGLHIKV